MDVLKPLRRVPSRILLPAAGVVLVTGAIGVSGLGLWPSLFGNPDPSTAAQGFAQVQGEAIGDGANVYTIADYVNRSPGERGEVDAVKGVVRSVVASLASKAGPGPTQRALGKIFDEDPVIGTEAPPDLVAALPPAAADVAPVALQQASLAQGPTGFAGAPIFAAAPGGVFIPAPGGPPGGGGGGGGGIIDVPTVPPPVTVVPEPGTWAMLILGLFGIGFTMRRARTRRPKRLIQSAS